MKHRLSVHNEQANFECRKTAKIVSSLQLFVQTHEFEIL